MRWWWWVLMACAGCGRIAFDPLPDARSSALVCAPGYTMLGEHCYRIATSTTEGVDWLAAELGCESEGAGTHLVVIDDAGEAAAVASFVGGAGGVDFWIGVTDLVAEGTYVTVTDKAPGFLVWTAGEPTGEGEDCLQMTTQSTVEDTPCDDSDDYVCEYDGVAAVPAAFGQ